MKGNLKKLSRSHQAEVPADLFQKIMRRIRFEQELALARQRFALANVLLLASLLLTVPAWQKLWLEFSQSGFGQYASLILSDFKTVLANWQDYGMALLESIPVVEIAGLLSVILLFLLALKFLVGNREKLLTIMALDNRLTH